MLTVFCSFRAASCFWRCSSPNTAQVFSHTPAGSSDPSQQAGSKNASVDGWYSKEKTDHTTHRLRANSGYLHRYVPHSRSRRYYPNMRSFLGRLVRLSRKVRRKRMHPAHHCHPNSHNNHRLRLTMEWTWCHLDRST